MAVCRHLGILSGVLLFVFGLIACEQSGGSTSVLPLPDTKIKQALASHDFSVSETGLTPVVDIDSEELSILMVGNSYLSYQPLLNGEKSHYSVARQFIDMTRKVIPGVTHRIHSIGGGTLQEHWERGESEGTPRFDLMHGQFDVMVIQGRYDILEKTKFNDRFDRYANLFAELAARHNVKVVFYGLWATDTQISSSGGDRFGPAANEIYCKAAVRHQAACAPNGMAYGLVYKTLASVSEDATLEEMLTDDFIHPSPPVAYMAANVVYSTIFAQEPLPLSIYQPPGTSDELGQLMRAAAWSATNAHGISGN